MVGLENDVILHSLYADFVIIITVIKFFFFLVKGCSGLMWDHSSQTRDRTRVAAMKVPSVTARLPGNSHMQPLLVKEKGFQGNSCFHPEIQQTLFTSFEKTVASRG